MNANEKARIEKAIAYWKTLKPRLAGEARLIERTIAELEARIA